MYPRAEKQFYQEQQKNVMTRFPMNRKILLTVTLMVFAFTLRPAMAGSVKKEKEAAEAYAREIMQLRQTASENLAKEPGPVTEQAFVKEYGKIYSRIAEIKQKKGVYVSFASTWPRNPQNRATPFELKIISRFKADPQFKKFWTTTLVGDKLYSRLVVPIHLEKSCLRCHGPADKRPAFIVKRYPADKSFGFKEGDLIGAMSVYVYIPEEKTATEDENKK